MSNKSHTTPTSCLVSIEASVAIYVSKVSCWQCHSKYMLECGFMKYIYIYTTYIIS